MSDRSQLLSELKALTDGISRYARIYEYDESLMPSDELQHLEWMRKRCKEVRLELYPADQRMMSAAITKAEKLL